MRRRAVVVAALVALVAAACDDAARSHIYSGRQYDESRGCLDDVSSIDIVAGPEPESPCAPVCVVGAADDAVASLVYVSTMCAPLPAPPYDTSGTDPRCPEALALYAANTTCLTDGGIANPLDAAPPADAGSTADATLQQDASDATVQDAAEASTD